MTENARDIFGLIVASGIALGLCIGIPALCIGGVLWLLK